MNARVNAPLTSSARSIVMCGVGTAAIDAVPSAYALGIRRTGSAGAKVPAMSTSLPHRAAHVHFGQRGEFDQLVVQRQIGDAA